MDNFPGPSDALFDQDVSRPECLDSFDPFWQEDDQLGSAWLNATESYRDGEQHQAIEEEGCQSRPIAAQQSYDYGSEAERPWEGIRYEIEWKAVVRTTRIGMDTEQEVSQEGCKGTRRHATGTSNRILDQILNFGGFCWKESLKRM